uniref:Polyhedrin n=1 Tax=Operophtera brumata cypovirus 19 TaxID=352246 RepID=Q30C66_9REOV|nr:polyhedrin [Operophtera brumata cypovirus 19]
MAYHGAPHEIRNRYQHDRALEILDRQYSRDSYIYAHLVLYMKDSSLQIIRAQNPRIISRSYNWDQLVLPNYRINDEKYYGRSELRHLRDGLLSDNGGRSQHDKGMNEPVSFQFIVQGDVDLGSVWFRVNKYNNISSSSFAMEAVSERAENYIGPLMRPIRYFDREMAWSYVGKFDGILFPCHPVISFAVQRANRDGAGLYNGENIYKTLIRLNDSPDLYAHYDDEETSVANYWTRFQYLYRTKCDIAV